MSEDRNPYVAPGLQAAYEAGRLAFASQPGPWSAEYVAFRRGFKDAERAAAERVSVRATALAAVLERREAAAVAADARRALDG